MDCVIQKNGRLLAVDGRRRIPAALGKRPNTDWWSADFCVGFAFTRRQIEFTVYFKMSKKVCTRIYIYKYIYYFLIKLILSLEWLYVYDTNKLIKVVNTNLAYRLYYHSSFKNHIKKKNNNKVTKWTIKSIYLSLTMLSNTNTIVSYCLSVTLFYFPVNKFGGFHRKPIISSHVINTALTNQ